MTMSGWQKAAIASWGLLAIIVILYSSTNKTTIINPDLKALLSLDNANFVQTETGTRTATSRPVATLKQDVMAKWFWDIGTDIKAAAKNCNLLLPKNVTFTGEYNALKDTFKKAFEASSRKGGLEGYSGQLPSETWVYHVMARKLHVKTVCETGFNAGHSTYVWLASHPSSKVMSFDLGVHTYSHQMSEVLTRMFPGRLTVTFGDSTKTLPIFKQRILKSQPEFKCDIIIVDGGHTHAIAKADIENFRSLAIPGHTLLAFDDYPSTLFPQHVLGAVWEEKKKSKQIAELFRCTMGKRGFVIGYYL